MRGSGRIFQRGNVLWVAYHLRGREFREPVRDKTGKGTSDRRTAEKYLAAKLKEVHADQIGARTFETPAVRRKTICDLLLTLQKKYELKGQDTAQNLCLIKRATQDFGNRVAAAVTADAFDEYKKQRLAAGDALASIQRVLQIIRAAYNHAVKRDKFPLHCVPFIGITQENNTRKDCYSEVEFRMIHQHLPPYLADFALFSKTTGMRFGEVCSLKWENIKGNVIELLGEDAKGDGSHENARLIPMVGKDLAGILERRTAARQVKHEGGVTLAAHIFHHNGHPIVDIRKAWASAIRKAGLRHLVFHTLRHSAVRMMDDAGLSRDVAMSLTGHKTQAMYSRYNVSDVKRKMTALQKLQAFTEVAAQQEQEPATNVVSMQR